MTERLRAAMTKVVHRAAVCLCSRDEPARVKMRKIEVGPGPSSLLKKIPVLREGVAKPAAEPLATKGNEARV